MFKSPLLLILATLLWAQAVSCCLTRFVAGEATPWQDVPAVCQVSGAQVPFDALLTLVAAYLQPVAMLDEGEALSGACL